MRSKELGRRSGAKQAIERGRPADNGVKPAPPSHFPGWPSVPASEALNDSWFDAPDLARRKAIAADIQRLAMEEVVYIPLGWFKNFTALRRDLTDRVRGFAIYWNVRRA